MKPRPVATALAVTAAAFGCARHVRPAAPACPADRFEVDGGCVACRASSDCPGGDFCDATGACAACSSDPAMCPAKAMACGADTDCPAGDFCAPGDTCQPGCRDDAECGAFMPSCCSGTCTDTIMDATMNCGGCGVPACAAGDVCCDDDGTGVCSDLQTDPDNCGQCNNSCFGLACIGGGCQTDFAVTALLDASGDLPRPDGGAVPAEVLQPVVYLQQAVLPQVSSTGAACGGWHFDSSDSAPPNAGTISAAGFAGGVAPDAGTPDQVQCTLGDGGYQCAYQAAGGGMAGPSPSATPLVPLSGNTDLLGTGAGAMVSFAAPGGPSFGSFDLSVRVPWSGFGVQEDLSTIQYSATEDTVLHLSCPEGQAANCGAGGIVAVLQATANDPADFAAPSASYGYVFCEGGFGTLGGIANGPPQVTIPHQAVAEMLAGDTSLRTIVSTLAVFPPYDPNDALSNTNCCTDVEGHTVIVLAGIGAFGVSPITP